MNEDKPKRKHKISPEGLRRLREGMAKARAKKSREVSQELGKQHALDMWAKRGRKPVAGRKYFRVGFAPDLLDHIETHRGEQSITDYIDPVLARGFGIPRTDGDERDGDSANQ